MDPLTAVVCHDGVAVRGAIHRLLGLNGLAVVAEPSTGAQAVDDAAAHQPRVLILDLALAGQAGFGLIRRIHAVAPRTAVIVLSPIESLAFLARRAGAVEVFTDEDLSSLRRILPELVSGSSPAATR